MASGANHLPVLWEAKLRGPTFILVTHFTSRIRLIKPINMQVVIQVWKYDFACGQHICRAYERCKFAVLFIGLFRPVYMDFQRLGHMQWFEIFKNLWIFLELERSSDLHKPVGEKRVGGDLNSRRQKRRHLRVWHFDERLLSSLENCFG